jgi:serine/threonine protein kinase
VALKMEVTDKGLIFGTPHYMSPEQGHGKEIDARSDIYSLGVMLFEMLTGKKPFDAENHMAILVHHAKAPIPRLPERLASLQPILDRLMAKEPADRPPDAATAARMLADALSALPPPSTGATATAPMPALTSSHSDIPAAPLSGTAAS